MGAKNCAWSVVVGAVVMGACRADAPTAPRQLFLEPFCEGACFMTGDFAASNEWLTHLNGTAGAPLSLIAEVVDGRGNAVPGVTMRWAVVSMRTAIVSAAVTSDASGVLRLHWTLDTLVSLDSMRGLFPTGDSVLAIATVSHAAPAIATKVSGDSQVVAVGATPAPFVVRLSDRYGNPVQGVNVAWTLGGLGTMTSETIKTDGAGRASNALVSPTTIGTYAVIATFGILPALVFRVDVR
jgi:hypothetical protein